MGLIKLAEPLGNPLRMPNTSWVEGFEMYSAAALCRRWAWVPMTIACWLLMVAPAMAQDEAEGPKENSWALAYVLVLLGVGWA